ncbi:HTH/CBS domain-containing protein [methanogenic archaeon ISO4-H5]|nr:HTH/CBS domain-containing protein [methanogenic archaeon ISO4-H5]
MKFPPASDIRRMRKALDITQTELAKESGVSQSTIAKIEKDRISASYETVVKLFETLEEMSKNSKHDLTAAEVATKEIITIQSNEKVRAATEIMRSSGVSQLPVLKGDTPVGSISEKIIFDKMRSGKTMDELKDMPIHTIMDDNFPSVNENTPMSSVTAMMSDCSAVLVLRKGKPVGIITKADLLKLI